VSESGRGWSGVRKSAYRDAATMLGKGSASPIHHSAPALPSLASQNMRGEVCLDLDSRTLWEGVLPPPAVGGGGNDVGEACFEFRILCVVNDVVVAVAQSLPAIRKHWIYIAHAVHLGAFDLGRCHPSLSLSLGL
jgi:hypothetical protein